MADNAVISGLEFTIESNAEKAADGIDKLAESFSKLKSALGESNGLKSIAKNLESISNALNGSHLEKIEGVANALKTLGEVNISKTLAKRIREISSAMDSISATSIANVQNAAKALSGLGSANVPVLNRSGAIGSQESETKTVLSKAVDANGSVQSVVRSYRQASAGTKSFSKTKSELKGISSVGKGVANVGKSIGLNLGTRLTGKLKSAVSGFGRLFDHMKRIAMYRAIRTFFSMLTNSIKDGVNNLYRYTSLMGGQFTSTMDGLATSFMYLKNSIGAAVSPLINALAPAIEFVIDKFVNLLNIVNQVFARLGGGTSYTVAKKAAISYGDVLGDTANAATDAAKEIKDATTGIDELNIISQNDDSGSGSGSGGSSTENYGDMFETVPIDQNISDFVDRLKAAFENGDWETLGTTIGNKINEVINSINWYDAGVYLGNGLNGIIETADAMMNTIDFVNIGVKLSEGINGLFATVDFSALGDLVANTITAIPDMIIGAIQTIDFGQIGRSVSSFFSSLFGKLGDWMMSVDWVSVGESIFSGIRHFFTSLDIVSLAVALAKFTWGIVEMSIGLLLGWVKDKFILIFDTICMAGNAVKAGVLWVAYYAFSALWAAIEFCLGWLFNLFGVDLKQTGEDVRNWLMDEIDNTGYETRKSMYKVVGDLTGLEPVYEEKGKTIAGGFTKGLSSQNKLVKNAVSDIGTIANSTLSQKVNASGWYRDGNSAGGGRGFAGGISSAADEVSDAASELGASANAGLASNFSEMIYKTKGKDIIVSLSNGITSNSSSVNNAMKNLASGANSSFDGTSNSSVFVQKAASVVRGLVSGLNGNSGSSNSAASALGSGVSNSFSNNANYSNFAWKAASVVSGVIDGLNGNMGNAYGASSNFGWNVSEWFSQQSNYNTFWNKAYWVVEGFREGIEDRKYRAIQVMSNLGISVGNALAVALGIASPSKLMYKYAGFTVEGFNNGIIQEGESTKRVIGAWADSFTSDFSSTMTMGVDASALQQFDTEEYARNISASVRSSTDITSDGFLSAMETFYKEHMESTFIRMADDMRRQADKDESPVVQIGNRVISDVVQAQKKANGYSFTR